jgi:hypothetical protein
MFLLARERGFDVGLPLFFGIGLAFIQLSIRLVFEIGSRTFYLGWSSCVYQIDISFFDINLLHTTWIDWWATSL